MIKYYYFHKAYMYRLGNPIARTLPSSARRRKQSIFLFDFLYPYLPRGREYVSLLWCVESLRTPSI